MARHRSTRGSRRIVTAGAATATATALTVGMVAPAEAATARSAVADVDLTAGVHLFPPPGQLPDLTGGLGSNVYDLQQAFAEQLVRGFVETVNLAAVAQALGLDPQSVLTNALGQLGLSQLLGGVLDGVLGALGGESAGLSLEGLLGLDPESLEEGLPGLGAILDWVLGNIVDDVLGSVVGALLGDAVEELVAGLIDVLGKSSLINLDGLLQDVTLGRLLGLLGLDLSDPLNLADLNLPGVNVVTAGAPFTLAKLFGVDLGWQPALPNPVASDINDTRYLEIGVLPLLAELGLPLVDVDKVRGVLESVDITLPNLVALRAVAVVGFGLGAYAAGAAYEQVLADLPNQPGGAAYDGDPFLLGSLTLLPLVLIRNPGRPNGGLFARLYPLGDLVGINTVTPETSVTSSVNEDNLLNVPVLNTGLVLGGANLLPVKLDFGWEYDPLSDFAAWPNPFTVANNLVAGLVPTYLLRGLDLSELLGSAFEQLEPQLEGILDGLLTEPLAVNLYFTVPAPSLPLLEPLYLATDFINLFTPGFTFNNPVATALNPLLTSLVNLGYTDAYWDADQARYDRTLTEANIPTAFGTLPAINWAEVPANLLTAAVRGFQQALAEGLISTDPRPNALRALLRLLGLDLDAPLGGGVPGLPNLLGDAWATAGGQLVSSAASIPDPNSTNLVNIAVDGATDVSNQRVELQREFRRNGDGPGGTGQEASGHVDTDGSGSGNPVPEKIEPEKIEPEKIEPENIEPEQSGSQQGVTGEDEPNQDTAEQAGPTRRAPAIRGPIGERLRKHVAEARADVGAPGVAKRGPGGRVTAPSGDTGGGKTGHRGRGA